MQTQELPCEICRRRKVKCSRTKPCTNCHKAGAECIYASEHRSQEPTAASVQELTQRIIHLEKSMEQMKAQFSGVAHPSRHENHVVIADSPHMRSQGDIIHAADRSRYISPTFRSRTYCDVIDARPILRDEIRPPDAEAIFSSSLLQESRNYVLPSAASSEYLLQAYLTNIDPFMKIVNKRILLVGFDNFRRGSLGTNSKKEFQPFIFAIFALALLSLNDDDVLCKVGENRRDLIERYKRYMAVGLSDCAVTTTHSITTMRLFLMYICLLLWTGEALQASSLLGLALRIAQRMGLHHDPARFNLSSWDKEIRRRLWHFLVHLDTCFIEICGLETTGTLLGSVTVESPQNNNDADWDLSVQGLAPSPMDLNNFTDMTHFLLQSELSALERSILNDLTAQPARTESTFDEQFEMLNTIRQKIETSFFKSLDVSKPIQRLSRDMVELSLSNISLMQIQTVISVNIGQETMTMKMKAFQLAVENCKKLQSLLSLYEPFNLDWIIVRQFSWHSMGTILSTMLRDDTLGEMVQAGCYLHYADQIMSHKAAIDYFAGNRMLWELVRCLQDRGENTQVNSTQDRTLASSQDVNIN